MAPDFLYAYVHAINPFALQLWGNFGIRWYGLAYLAGFYAGYLIIRWMTKRGISPLKPELVSDFVFIVACGTIIGGRLGYCLFYSPDLFVQFSASPPFWGVFAINQGGMASHGGILGIVIACGLYGRKHKLSCLHLMDLTTLGGLVGIFFGRIANFINGELVGREISWAAPWAVKFPQDMLSWAAHEPQRLKGLEASVALLGVPAAEWEKLTGQHLSYAAYERVQQTVERLVQAIQNGNAEIAAAVAPHLSARHPSQLYEALLEGLFLFLILIFFWRRARRPGLITGIFLVTYSIVRCIGEQFRLPDIGIGYQALGLTRGQWLSLLMLSFGIGLFCYCTRRSEPELGGWRQVQRPH